MECGLCGVELGIWGLGFAFGVWCLVFRVLGLVFGAWGLGLGVWAWCLKFEFWNFGFGVWSLVVGFGGHKVDNRATVIPSLFGPTVFDEHRIISAPRLTDLYREPRRPIKSRLEIELSWGWNIRI